MFLSKPDKKHPEREEAKRKAGRVPIHVVHFSATTTLLNLSIYSIRNHPCLSFFFFFFFFYYLPTCRYLRHSFVFTGAIYIPTYIPINFPFFYLLPIPSILKKKGRRSGMITRFEKRVVGLQFPVFFLFSQVPNGAAKKVERRSNNDGW